MFVPVLQLRARNTAWLLGMVNYSWSLHIVLESPVCQKQDSWKKANKQKPSLRRVGSDIKGSSSVLPESPNCIFTDNQKNITEVLRNSTDPNCSHSMPKFCLCCHRNVLPTPKVHNINCIIWFSISFEGNELSTCHFTSHKKSCPRTKTGTWFHLMSGPPMHQTSHHRSHTLTIFPIHYSYSFMRRELTVTAGISTPNQWYNFHWFEMPRESLAQTKPKFRPPDSSEVKWHKYLEYPLLLYHVYIFMTTTGIAILSISKAGVQTKKWQPIQNYGWEPVLCYLLTGKISA